MIEIAGRRFVETESELVNSLFERAEPPVGMAKRFRRRIELYHRNGQLCGVVTSGGVIGRAETLPDGKKFFSYGDCELLGPLSLSEENDAVRGLSTGMDLVGGEIRYSFKLPPPVKQERRAPPLEG